MSELIEVSKDDLALVKDNALNAAQLGLLLKSTPAKYIKKRPAKGGGQWAYVSGGYVRKVLNLMFGWDWDFEVVEQLVQHGEAIVKGRLTCRVGDRSIVKMQFGNKEIMCKRGTEIPLSIGNDFKAAATDALKKCAAELGLAQDVYNKDEFRPVNVSQEVTLGMLIDHYEKHAKGKFSVDDQKNIERIISEKEALSYGKAYQLITNAKNL